MGKTKLKLITTKSNIIHHRKVSLKPFRIQQLYDMLILLSGTGLGLLALAFLLPVVTTSSSALSGSDYNKPAWIPSNYVTLSLDNMPTIDLIPREGGGVGVSQAKLNVSTTSNTGYKLYINTLDDTNAMTNVNVDQSATIQPVARPTMLADFKPNTWGYAITSTLDGSSNATYSPMPTTSAVAYDTTTTSGEHYLSFAASIDTSLPAGQYSNTVAISAITNPAIITGMMELTYMQDMTSSICKDTVGYDQNYNRDSSGSYIITPGNEVTKQLIDIRDGKEYWVAKLADGNCWMTQNLAYDLVKGKVLTPSDSDVSANWVVPTGTIVSETLTIPDDATEATSTYSWNLGEYVTATPASTSVCTEPGASQGDSVLPGSKPGRCDRIYNVANWRPIFSTEYGQFDDTSSYVSINVNEKTYDAHYLLGNYYQWRAAIAESTNANVSPSASAQDPNLLTVAPGSICPKGWQLPKSGYNAQGKPHNLAMSFTSLFAAYGYPKADQYPAISSGTPMTTLLTGDYQNVGLSPMSFARTGRIDPSRGALNALGHMGFYYSSVATTTPNYLFVFRIASTEIYPAFIMASNVGLPIRCLAK